MTKKLRRGMVLWLSVILIILIVTMLGFMMKIKKNSIIVEPIVTPTATPTITKSNMANPASVNCTQKGGQPQIQTKPDGSQYSLCFFEDNRACEEWAMYYGECPIGGIKTTGFDTEAQRFCAWSGGKTLAVKNAICTFSDGSKCPDEDFYAGTCQKGKQIK